MSSKVLSNVTKTMVLVRALEFENRESMRMKHNNNMKCFGNRVKYVLETQYNYM